MATKSQYSPNLTPTSTVSSISLPATGSTSDVATYTPFGIYSVEGSPLYSSDFVSGAVDQVAYTYWKLAGNVLDIEITTGNVYAAYEQATLEYSYLVNMHQAKNSLSDVLGDSTGSFDHDGNLKAGALSSSLGGTHVALKFPKFGFAYSRRVAQGFSQEAKVGGTETEYSASIDVTVNQQDYDLQEIISAKPEFSGSIGNKRILISKVFYKSPRAAWRFYGYYGGLTTVGNFHNYGQWADDSSFEIIPIWHNKMQAIQYENAIYTRLSHYSYEIKNNKLRLYPPPTPVEPKQLWVRFYIPQDAWSEEGGIDNGADGINNVNTLPFANIPYESINAMGKQWIRDYAFSLSMEQLGYVRSKFATVPIPGESVTLNGPELINRAKEEQNRLRDQLQERLDQLTYEAIVEADSNLADSVDNINSKIPLPIFTG